MSPSARRRMGRKAYESGYTREVPAYLNSRGLAKDWLEGYDEAARLDGSQRKTLMEHDTKDQ